MTWRTDRSKAQRAERRVKVTALRGIGWRGDVDATGHPLDDGVSEFATRGYHVGADSPWSPRVQALVRECLEVEGEQTAIWGGGCDHDVGGEIDAFTQWAGRRSAGRGPLRRWAGRWRRGRR